MINLASSISLYTHTSVNEAMALPVSMAERILACKSFEQWQKSREAEHKTQSAIVNGLGSVIRALGIVAKVINRKRSL